MLSYEKYNNTRLAVRGDREKYQSFIKTIGGRWNSRMRGGEGWLVPVENEEIVINAINQMLKESKLSNMENNIKSRKKQNRYHREQSDEEEDDEKLKDIKKRSTIVSDKASDEASDEASDYEGSDEGSDEVNDDEGSDDEASDDEVNDDEVNDDEASDDEVNDDEVNDDEASDDEGSDYDNDNINKEPSIKTEENIDYIEKDSPKRKFKKNIMDDPLINKFMKKSRLTSQEKLILKNKIFKLEKEKNERKQNYKHKKKTTL